MAAVAWIRRSVAAGVAVSGFGCWICTCLNAASIRGPDVNGARVLQEVVGLGFVYINTTSIVVGNGAFGVFIGKFDGIGNRLSPLQGELEK